MEVYTELFYLSYIVVLSLLAGALLLTKEDSSKTYEHTICVLSDDNKFLENQNEKLQEQIKKIDLLTVKYLREMYDVMELNNVWKEYEDN